ncbi:MAG: tetratricopeptide repeat protein [Polyangiaceae bacterium]|nr:tetratricopeptide repeat protein [Polyangiaceae bacterium]
MRIAVVLDPPALDASPITWLQSHAEGRKAVLVTLPSIDPLARALAHALGEHTPGDGDVFVLARAGGGRATEDDYAALAASASCRRLEPVEDPALEEAIAEGARRLDAGELDRAQRAYAFAESLLASDTGPRHAEVLVCLASIERRTGSTEQAVALLDRALAIFPNHEAALKERIAIARECADNATAAALRRRLLRKATTDPERAEQLSSIADECLNATIEALEQALALRPRDPRLLERLQSTLEAAGRWSEAVDAKVALSETIGNPRDRARSLSAAAGMCARRTGHVARAVALYEAAIADDPTTPGAFDAIEAVLVRSESWREVESAYGRQLERLAERGEQGARAALLDKLSRLRDERMGDTEGAIVALDQLVQQDPKAVDVRARLAELLERTGQLQLAALALESAALWAPSRVATFRELNRLLTMLGDPDRAYSACAVLVHLGEADVAEQAVYRQYAPQTTVRPSSALGDRGFSDLFVPEHDFVISRIVRALGPPAIELKLAQLRKAGRLPVLEPKNRQDPDKSTITAVRTVGWACKVLGLPVPAIYTHSDDLPGGVVSAPLPEPTLVLGKSLLSGRSVPELVFAIGRELSCQHLASRVLTFYPTLPELRALLLAAVGAVVPTSLPADALALREALAARLGDAQRAELTGAVRELEARDGRLELKPWLCSLELAACRAGLLVSGDVTAAARMLAVDGRVVGGLSAADRIRDAIPFSVSTRYATLRRTLGIGVGSQELPARSSPSGLGA